MRRWITGKGKKRFFIYLIWIFLSICTLFPIYWLFLVSARSRIELFGGPTFFQTTFYIKNFTRPLLNDIYGSYIFNSVIIATGNTILVMICAIFATYALSRYRFKGANNIFFWTITNRMAPAAAFMFPIFLLYSRVLVVGEISLFDTHIGMILVYCLFNLPFAIWLLKGIVDGIPISIDEAARIDGASTLGIVWRIIVPLSAPGIAVASVLSWIFAWNEYLFAAALTSSDARTITTGLAEFVTIVGTNWGEMAAVALVSVLPALLFLGFVQKYIVAGITFGAVRE